MTMLLNYPLIAIANRYRRPRHGLVLIISHTRSNR